MSSQLPTPQTPELKAILDAMTLRKASWHLKTRLLRGVVAELQAAHNVGLTWLEVWKVLAAAGYPGSYPQFCKTANRFLFPERTKSKSAPIYVPASIGETISSQKEQHTGNTGDRPKWIQRQETAARVAREAQRIQEEQSQKDAFTMAPFVRRQED
jgi:hypothetical protein